MSTLRIGSLFTGTTALDMAAHDVLGGGEVVWHLDVKPAAVRLLAHRFPDVPNLGDITTLFPVDTTSGHLAGLDDLDPGRWLPVVVDVPAVDVLTFGWPCQPHSSAGKRLGEADPRALLRNVLRGVAHLRPRILFGENVARVTTNGELRRAVRALAALGYVGAWRCVTAAERGAPHKRDRVALVAVRADAAADALGIGLGPHLDDVRAGEPDAARRGDLTLLPTPAARDGKGVMPRGDRVDGYARSFRQLDLPGAVRLLLTPTQSMTTGAGTSGRQGGLNFQTAAVTLLPTPTRGEGVRGSSDANRVARDDGRTMAEEAVLMHGFRWGVYADAVHRWERVLDRVVPAPTMTSPRTGGPQLSPWFVEWMMGLPAGWVCDVPDLAPKAAGWRNAALSLLGDGVVPQQLAHGFRLALNDLATQSQREGVFS